MAHFYISVYNLAIGVNYIRDAVIIGFMANELISIVENAGLMGVPLPAVIQNAIDILTKQSAEKKSVDNAGKGGV